MKPRPQCIVLASLAILLGSGCQNLAQPAFEAGSFTPDPTALGTSDSAQVAATVAAMTPLLTMFEPGHEMLLMGTPLLDAGSGETLTVNLRQEGSSFRSPCSYWFRVPIDPGAWEVSEAKLFRVRVGVGEFEVDEACGSPFSADTPLIFSFREPGQGAQFMNAMAALQTSAAAAKPEAPPEPPPAGEPPPAEEPPPAAEPT